MLQFVGLDTLSAIARGWREERVSTGELEAKSVEEVQVLEKLLQEGKKGRKSGEGFFKCELYLILHVDGLPDSLLLLQIERWESAGELESMGLQAMTERAAVPVRSERDRLDIVLF